MQFHSYSYTPNIVTSKVEHHKELRERRFERLMGAVTGDDIYLKGHVTEVLREQSSNYARKIGDAYNGWTHNVYENIQSQLDGILNPPDRQLIQSFTGSRNVEFAEEKPPVVKTNPKSNPTYADLLKQHSEHEFQGKTLNRYGGLSRSIGVSGSSGSGGSGGLSNSGAIGRIDDYSDKIGIRPAPKDPMLVSAVHVDGTKTVLAEDKVEKYLRGESCGVVYVLLLIFPRT